MSLSCLIYTVKIQPREIFQIQGDEKNCSVDWNQFVVVNGYSNNITGPLYRVYRRKCRIDNYNYLLMNTFRVDTLTLTPLYLFSAGKDPRSHSRHQFTRNPLM